MSRSSTVKLKTKFSICLVIFSFCTVSNRIALKTFTLLHNALVSFLFPTFLLFCFFLLAERLLSHRVAISTGTLRFNKSNFSCTSPLIFASFISTVLASVATLSKNNNSFAFHGRTHFPY